MGVQTTGNQLKNNPRIKTNKQKNILWNEVTTWLVLVSKAFMETSDSHSHNIYLFFWNFMKLVILFLKN